MLNFLQNYNCFKNIFLIVALTAFGGGGRGEGEGEGRGEGRGGGKLGREGG